MIYCIKQPMKTLNLLLLIILIPACKMLSPANADDLQIVDQARNKQALILDVARYVITILLSFVGTT